MFILFCSLVYHFMLSIYLDILHYFLSKYRVPFLIKYPWTYSDSAGTASSIHTRRGCGRWHTRIASPVFGNGDAGQGGRRDRVEGDSAMDQIRGGCGGGWQSMVKAARGHALPALPVRAASPAGQWQRDAGHGGPKSGGDGRSRVRSHGQCGNIAARCKG